MIALDRERLRRAVPEALVVGADGMLGRAFMQLLADLDLPHSGVTIKELDITDAAAVADRVREPVVINCAAWTNVDGAETNEAAATLVNGRGVANLRDACFEHEGFLVNYGTDYVFAGTSTRPYPIDEPLAPLNAYGRSKAEGERAMSGVIDHLYIRTSWLYAPWGNNFVRTIARLLREKPAIKVVDDQRGRPTSAEHLARATLALLQVGSKGFAHATDGGQCTWFDFAREIGKLTGAAGAVEPCTSAEFPRPAKRPAYSVLDIAHTERLIGPMPDWKANLAEVIARLE
ncbi:MAG: dTDP-4-dehydrorhamnose reductase [Phycisphaerales bacterium]